MKGKLFRFSAGNSRKNGQQVPGKFTSSKQWRRKSISSFKTHSPRVEMPWKCSKLQPLFSPQSLLLKNVWKKNLSTWSGGEFPSFPPLLLMWGVHYSSWGGPPLQKMGVPLVVHMGFFLKTQEKKTNLGHKNPPISRGGYVLDPCCSCGFCQHRK